MKKADEATKAFEAVKQSEEEKKLWDDFTAQSELWTKDHQLVLNLAEEKQRLLETGVAEDTTRVRRLDDDMFKASQRANAAWSTSDEMLDKLIQVQKKSADEEGKQAERTSASSPRFF